MPSLNHWMVEYPSLSHFIPPRRAQYTWPFLAVKQIRPDFLRSFAFSRGLTTLHTTGGGFPLFSPPPLAHDQTDDGAPSAWVHSAKADSAAARAARRPGTRRGLPRRAARQTLGRIGRGARPDQGKPVEPIAAGPQRPADLPRLEVAGLRGIVVDRKQEVCPGGGQAGRQLYQVSTA